MDFAAKQGKSRQDSIHCKLVMGSKNFHVVVKLLDMWSNFDPHEKQNLSCGAKLLHMNFFAPQTMYAASATNIIYALVALAVLALVALILCCTYYFCRRGECLYDTIVTTVIIFNAQLSQRARMMLRERLSKYFAQSNKPGVQIPSPKQARLLQQLFLVSTGLHLSTTLGFWMRRPNCLGLWRQASFQILQLRFVLLRQQFPQLQLIPALIATFLARMNRWPGLWRPGRKTETLLRST